MGSGITGAYMNPAMPKWGTPDKFRADLTGDPKADRKAALKYGGAAAPWLMAVDYESKKKRSKAKDAAEIAALDTGAPKADLMQVQEASAAARAKARRFAYGSYGRSDTIVTGPKGLEMPTKPKTLLGY